MYVENLLGALRTHACIIYIFSLYEQHHHYLRGYKAARTGGLPCLPSGGRTRPAAGPPSRLIGWCSTRALWTGESWCGRTRARSCYLSGRGQQERDRDRKRQARGPWLAMTKINSLNMIKTGLKTVELSVKPSAYEVTQVFTYEMQQRPLVAKIDNTCLKCVP